MAHSGLPNFPKTKSNISLIWSWSWNQCWHGAVKRFSSFINLKAHEMEKDLSNIFQAKVNFHTLAHFIIISN